MLSGKEKGPLAKEAPWRAYSDGGKPIPRINLPPLLAVPRNPSSQLAISILKHPDPVGSGLAMPAMLESAGPDCILPGKSKPRKLLGLKVWPVEVDLTLVNRAGQGLQSIAKTIESAVEVMNRAFLDR